MRRRILLFLTLLGGLLMTGLPAQATTLEQLGLNDLVTRADKVFRGTVIDVEQKNMEIGGGELPYVAYRLRVDDLLKGTADITKGDKSVIEINVIGSIKASTTKDGMEQFSVFHDVPKLAMGSDYVLFMTPRSSAGLSAPVGLGQGAFNIVHTTKDDMAVNQFDNMGLGLGDGGPVSYDDLKSAVLSATGQ